MNPYECRYFWEPPLDEQYARLTKKCEEMFPRLKNESAARIATAIILSAEEIRKAYQDVFDKIPKEPVIRESPNDYYKQKFE